MNALRIIALDHGTISLSDLDGAFAVTVRNDNGSELASVALWHEWEGHQLVEQMGATTLAQSASEWVTNYRRLPLDLAD